MGYEDLNTIGAGGSPILEIDVGRSYGRSDRPGLYTIVQYESAEEVLVREAGSGALEKIRIELLAPLDKPGPSERTDLALIEEEKIKRAEEMLEAIKDLIPLRRIKLEKWKAQSEKTGIPVKTLRQWHRRYRKDPRLSSLMRRRRSDAGEPRLNPLVEAAIERRLAEVLADGNLTLTSVYENLQDEIALLAKQHPKDKIVCPVFSTFYTRYRRVSEYDKDAAKLGKRQAGLLHNLQKGSLRDADHPLAVEQVDHLELPVMVVDEVDREGIGKGWITLLIDIWSRSVAGFYITLESPGDLSLGMAMCNAILPKTELLKQLDYEASWPVSGFMWCVHSDNAGEFHGNMQELNAKEYAFELVFRKVKQPQYGGYIETYLGTLSEKLRHLPGATREGKDALGDYDPTKDAVMTLAELERYVLNLIIEYHNSPHSGIGGMTPLARLREGLKGNLGAIPIGRLRHAADPVKLMLDFLPAKERVISPKGVVWDHVWYMDDCLQRWVHARDPKNIDEARKFLFRRDPRDITRTYFWDPEERIYKVIRTRDPTRPKMSLWEFNAIRSYLKKRGVEDIDEELIFKSRQDRRDQLAKAQAKTKKAKLARDRERRQRAEEGAKKFQERVEDTKPTVSEPPVPPPASAQDTEAQPFEMSWDD
jgi:putative transposase